MGPASAAVSRPSATSCRIRSMASSLMPVSRRRSRPAGGRLRRRRSRLARAARGWRGWDRTRPARLARRWHRARRPDPRSAARSRSSAPRGPWVGAVAPGWPVAPEVRVAGGGAATGARRRAHEPEVAGDGPEGQVGGAVTDGHGPRAAPAAGRRGQVRADVARHRLHRHRDARERGQDRVATHALDRERTIAGQATFDAHVATRRRDAQAPDGPRSELQVAGDGLGDHGAVPSATIDTSPDTASTVSWPPTPRRTIVPDAVR